MSATSPKTWFVVEVKTRAEAREAIEYGLMEAGALGTETDDRSEPIAVRAYFETQPDLVMIRESLSTALRVYEFDSSAIISLNPHEIADRDWLAEWKKSWQPVQVGRFIIAPPWLSVPGAIVSEPGAVATGSSETSVSADRLTFARPADKLVIRINPGMAFGTGTHETTRLCLRAIEKHFRGGSFLDVGTGTGILAIAAAKLFADAVVEACDTDADAVAIAKENAELNGVADEIDFRVGSVDEQTSSADFVCANLTAPVIVELLPSLIGATCGRLVLSGILDAQVDLVRARLAELGIVDFAIDADGEWVALVI